MNKHKVLMDHSIPRSFAIFGFVIFTGLPLILISPCSGWYKPNSTFINVDFLHHFLQVKHVSHPALLALISSFATMPGNTFVMLFISITYSIVFLLLTGNIPYYTINLLSNSEFYTYKG